MNERFIQLLEKYLNSEISSEEKIEFEKLIESNPDYRSEFEEQKRIKEVLKKMKLKNPSKEVWDNYWVGVYNNLERGIAWIAITIGAVIVLGYAAFFAVKEFLQDTGTPILLKLGISVLVFGLLFLLYSIIREKLTVGKSDKYKEIQRWLFQLLHLFPAQK